MSIQNGSWKDTKPFTLDDLKATLAEMPKFEQYPPYYACNQQTYDNLKRNMSRGAPREWTEVTSFYDTEIRVDNEVPDGEFRPAKGWEK